MKVHVLTLSARLLALAWAGFWMFFFVVESVVTHAPIRNAMGWIAFGLILCFVALIPWRWETAGGFLLVGLGVTGGIAYGLWSPAGLHIVAVVLTILVYTAPALVAGGLFLLDHTRQRHMAQHGIN